MQKTLFNVAEAAQMLDFSPVTVVQMIKQGALETTDNGLSIDQGATFRQVIPYLALLEIAKEKS